MINAKAGRLVSILVLLLALSVLIYLYSSSPDSRSEVTLLPPEPSTPTSAVPNPPKRIEIPRLGVAAPIIILGVDADGTMQSPAGPLEVAWYDFSALPGSQGNSVMSGHLDFARYGPAVFWRLEELKAGDEIGVELSDGTRVSYLVANSKSYPAYDAPLEEIVGETESSILTLITCDGTFDRRTKDYSRRLVVKAQLSSVASTKSPTSLRDYEAVTEPGP